jgi:hypothetical protein
MAQNIAGLMMAFTPMGMTKAMAMQAQMQASGQAQRPATGFEVTVVGPEGEEQVVEIVMKNAEGEGIITTKWLDENGTWKVNDIGLKN